MIEMSSGCLCWTIRGDLARTLSEAPARFARNGKVWFDRVIIETTGLADPAPILHTLMTDWALIQRYRLDGVITTVDALNGSDTLDRQVESVKQAAVADRLLLTKADLVPTETLRTLQQRLRGLNPGAPQIVADNGVVDPASLFEAGLYDPKTKSVDVQRWLNTEAFSAPSDHRHPATGHDEEHGHGHEHGGHDHSHHHSDGNRHDDHIRAFCITLDEPVRDRAIYLWFDALLMLRGPDFLRIKGILNVVGLEAPVVIHAVQQIFHPPVRLKKWPSEDRRSRIVFITRDIEESALRDTLTMVCHERTEAKEVRCCVRDEGRPLEAGGQEQASNHRKLRRSRAVVVSVAEKAGLRFRQVGSAETSASEPLMTCRKRMDDVETGGMSLTRDKSGRCPDFGPDGIRHGGGVTVDQALARNVGTCRPDAKGEIQTGGPR